MIRIYILFITLLIDKLINNYHIIINAAMMTQS
jgi:hypothetical protein